MSQAPEPVKPGIRGKEGTGVGDLRICNKAKQFQLPCLQTHEAWEEYVNLKQVQYVLRLKTEFRRRGLKERDKEKELGL